MHQCFLFELLKRWLRLRIVDKFTNSESSTKADWQNTGVCNTRVPGTWWTAVHSSAMLPVVVTCVLLVVLNNKILRIIQRQKMTTSVRNLYSNYNCLPIPLLHDYQLLLIVHKCMFHQNLLPEVFHDYFVCNTLVHSHCTRSSYNLHLYSIRSGFGSRCIKFKASQLWNALPADLLYILLIVSNLNFEIIFLACVDYMI